ncbi:nitroreductase family protein [Leptolyngbya sp. FACHB-36]|uniref:nitroreductase family protein n=1 Tax=Leptolyngbya sp. FACHB-36 TaxID=2692808 RepID=UPI0016805363|nr:nitroreductase family protein [Leptolyngbya sp. FACHB-36]MBD2020450.1 nitroreductase family protein [Leptolyngbya sp. FACHB-36]
MTQALDRNLQTQPLDVPSAIVQRRAIKNFKPDAIAPELLRRLVELTVAAPSSWNLQDWRIVLVQDEAQKKALAEAAWNQQQILQAPVTFVFAADPNAWQDREQINQIALETGAWAQQNVDYFNSAIPQFQAMLGDKTREYAVKDAVIAATHLALAAESFGLSSCFMNGWIEDQVKAVIGASDTDLAIAVVVPIGYAADPRGNPGRLPFSNNVFVDRVGTPYEG